MSQARVERRQSKFIKLSISIKKKSNFLDNNNNSFQKQIFSITVVYEFNVMS